MVIILYAMQFWFEIIIYDFEWNSSHYTLVQFGSLADDFRPNWFQSGYNYNLNFNFLSRNFGLKSLRCAFVLFANYAYSFRQNWIQLNNPYLSHCFLERKIRSGFITGRFCTNHHRKEKVWLRQTHQ